MADGPGKRTAGAQRAHGLAELVNKIFETERVPSSLAAHAGYRVEMSGPEVQSTTSSSGAQHHLRLVPADAANAKPEDGGAATIDIGTADVNLTQLELRTYEELGERHAARYQGEPLPIERAAFEALKTKIEQSLEPQGIETISSATRHDPTVRPGEIPMANAKPVWALVVAGIVIALAAIFFALEK
jgi:hypothetical protein